MKKYEAPSKMFWTHCVGFDYEQKGKKIKKHTYIAYGQLHADVSSKLTEGFHFYFYICLKL